MRWVGTDKLMALGVACWAAGCIQIPPPPEPLRAQEDASDDLAAPDLGDDAHALPEDLPYDGPPDLPPEDAKPDEGDLPTDPQPDEPSADLAPDDPTPEDADAPPDEPDPGCAPDTCGPDCEVCQPGEACVEGACVGAPWEDLLDERVGFGREARGGQGGALCAVTRLEDDEAPGSLRACLAQPAPRWVRFEVSGALALASPLPIPSFTTLDGRGADISLVGHPITILGAQHVILHNLSARDVVTENRDLIEVRASSHVWLDRLTLRRSVDELVGVVEGSSAVTISRCVFEDQEQIAGMLIGNDAALLGDEVQEVTLHHNWFRLVRSNLPRLRFGKVHAFNNFFEGWDAELFWVTMGGQLASERNVFMPLAPLGNIARTTREGEQEGFVRSTEDLHPFATFEVNGPERVFEPASLYPYEPDEVLGLPELVRLNAGRRGAEFPE